MQGKGLPIAAIIISLISATASSWSAFTAYKAQGTAQRTLALSEEDVRVSLLVPPYSRIFFHSHPEIKTSSVEVSFQALVTNVGTRPNSILRASQHIFSKSNSSVLQVDHNLILDDSKLASFPLTLQPGSTYKIGGSAFLQFSNLPATTLPDYFRECSQPTLGGLAGYVLSKTGRSIYGDDSQREDRYAGVAEPCNRFMDTSVCGHPETISIGLRLESASSRRFFGYAPITPYECG